jgi:protein-S-isoprenylcysteine O-methyltransferase Ste14
VGEINPAVSLAAAILGGTLAAGTHGLKAGTRLLINTSPEPFSNWTASIAEDILVIGGIWTAVNHPWLFLALLALFILLTIWLLPKVWRGIRMLAAKLKQLLTPRRASPPLS